jgi:glycosidase
VVVRAPRDAVSGGMVAFNDRYAWQGTDYAPMRRHSPLRVYARDGELTYWAADLDLHPPRIRYRFGLETANGTRWFGWDGLRDSPRPRGAFEFAYLAEGDRPDLPDWTRGAIFYQIFPDRFARSSGARSARGLTAWDAPPKGTSVFGGDLDGIVERLDHITALGAEALYLTPIFDAPSNHRYDTADYFKVDPRLGGDNALRRLVQALHGRGMRLVLDGVFNHAGRTWPPFVDVLEKGAASEYADWFYFQDGRYEEGRYETWATNVASLPKLRTTEPALRDLICKVGRYWIEEFGIDGWRLDVANEVDHALWRRFREVVRAARPEGFLVGEIWDWAMPWLRGDQFDSTMNYPLRRALLRYASLARGESADVDGPLDGNGVLDALDRIRAAYPEPLHSHLYNLLGSHDEPRPLSVLRGDRAGLAVAAALLYTLPGIVSIYYGDEVGMEGGKDPLNRGAMVWDESRQDKKMHSLHTRLGKLRGKLPALREGSYERLDGRGSLAAFARRSSNGAVVVVANAGKSPESVSQHDIENWLGGKVKGALMVAHEGSAKASASRGKLGVPAQSVAVFSSTPVAE